MNKTFVPFLATLLVSACSSSGMNDGGSTTIYNLTGGNTGGTTGGGPVAKLRVAELSADAPAFDYCLAVHGTETADAGFVGPILLGRGALDGLAYPSVADYTSLTPETYDVRFVQPSSPSCYPPGATTVLPDLKNLPALAAGGSYTVAIMGSFSAPTIATYTDDTSTSSDVGLRLIQASHGYANIDMSANNALQFANVAFATVPPAGGSVDANGYTGLVRPYAGYDAGFLAPLTYSLSFSVHGSSSTVLVVPCVTFTEGSVNSVFTIPPPGTYPAPIAALVCYDSLEPRLGITQCVAMPVPGSSCQ
jgi:hypothetical protein